LGKKMMPTPELDEKMNDRLHTVYVVNGSCVVSSTGAVRSIMNVILTTARNMWYDSRKDLYLLGMLLRVL
jgi:small nuclear ribonucleoprotein (snRNP)-like protein